MIIHALSCDPLRNKILHDGETLVLMGYLTENERRALLNLSKEADYQDAIEYLFWKSKSPHDTGERKERNDKDFVTEKFIRMNPIVHCLLAAWLIVIGVGSVIVFMEVTVKDQPMNY